MTTLSNLPQAPEAVDDVEGIVVNAPNAPNPSDVTHKGRLRSVATLLSRVFTYLTTTRLSDLEDALAPGIAPKVFAEIEGEDVTPVWGAASSAPALENGTLTGRVISIGPIQRVSITLTIGADTTMGSGAWNFTLPSPLDGNAAATAIGSVVGRDATGSRWRVGSCRVLAGENQIECFTDDVADAWSATVPHTWDDGDTLTLSIEYETEAPSE